MLCVTRGALLVALLRLQLRFATCSTLQARSWSQNAQIREWKDNVRPGSWLPHERIVVRNDEYYEYNTLLLRGGGVANAKQDEIAGYELSPKLKEELTSSLECTMCLNLLCQPVTLRCGHSYCSYCITSWLRTGNNICPLCRSPGENHRP